MNQESGVRGQGSKIRGHVHQNSLAAYRSEGRHLHSREIEILIWASNHTGSYTDRAIAELMGFAHRADVQPRISTLVADGLLHENGKTPCPVTGKLVRAVRITEKGKRWLAGDRSFSDSKPTNSNTPSTTPYTPARHVIPAVGQCALFA
jgi:hypothetical protein